MAPLLLVFSLVLVAAQSAVAAPQSDQYHRDHVRLHLFNKANAQTTKGFQLDEDLNLQNFLDAGFEQGLPTKVLIHGFNNGVGSDSMQLPKNAYFAIGSYNILVVDWSDLNPMPLYFAGVGNSAGVGERVAEVLDWMADQGLIKAEDLHIVGHSLGAHVAAITAEKMASGRVARITGLDPARPFIDFTVPTGRLSIDDADLVDVLHTNAGTLGEQQAVGHVDFYPNGGKAQPGCPLDFTGACSHGRSYEMFAESITNPTAFIAYKCEDEWDALHQRCEENQVYAYAGDSVSFSEEGSYYLETRNSKPYSLTA